MKYMKHSSECEGLSRREALRLATSALLSLPSLGLGIPASADAAKGEMAGKFPERPPLTRGIRDLHLK
jgi:hypothetical protein